MTGWRESKNPLFVWAGFGDVFLNCRGGFVDGGGGDGAFDAFDFELHGAVGAGDGLTPLRERDGHRPFAAGAEDNHLPGRVGCGSIGFRRDRRGVQLFFSQCVITSRTGIKASRFGDWKHRNEKDGKVLPDRNLLKITHTAATRTMMPFDLLTKFFYRG